MIIQGCTLFFFFFFKLGLSACAKFAGARRSLTLQSPTVNGDAANSVQRDTSPRLSHHSLHRPQAKRHPSASSHTF